MDVSEARTMLAGDGHFEAWEPEPYLRSQERWLGLLATFSDAIEPVGQHAAFADLSGHPNPEATATQLLTNLSKHLGLGIRLGLASARFVARLAAERGDPDFMALKNPKKYVALFPVEALPLPGDVSTRLRFLGYPTIGQVAGLSQELLRPVFGEAALEVARAAKGRGNTQVEAVYPPKSVTARFSFDGPIETSETLDFGLVELAGLLANCLAEQDGFSERLELFTEGDDGRVQVFSRTFARSIHTARDALAALRLMLAEPPKRPIIGIRARLRDVKRSRRVQAPLAFSVTRDDRAERSHAALAHVRKAFGDGVIQAGSELKEPRWKEVRRVYRAANGWPW
jgi:nucleotidyltransferase/DNA polymerase involved in DNA repair